MSQSGGKKEEAQVGLIADNRRARHDYQLEQSLEAGLVLEGWEVKSIRAGRVQLKESYVVVKDGAAWLLGSHISPLSTVSTHVTAVPDRTRKLLLNARELRKLIGAVQRKGFTIVPLNMHWRRGRAKVDIALAKGKQLYDKRQDEKHRDWEKQKRGLTNRTLSVARR
jgi:SsrA-binding protein